MKNTRRKTLLVAIALSVLLLAGASTPIFAGGDKVTVCHKPGTEAENQLEIAAAALPAHLAHGDREGSCSVPQSAGCDALNTVVPDPQVIPSAYFFAVTNLEFNPGEVIHADMTITASSSNWDSISQHASIGGIWGSYASDWGELAPGDTGTVSLDYTVDHYDLYEVRVGTPEYFGVTFTVDAVHFSCTPN